MSDFYWNTEEERPTTAETTTHSSLSSGESEAHSREIIINLMWDYLFAFN